MCVYEFKFSYKENSLNVLIGIKDSLVYSFAKNDLKNPMFMFSLKSEKNLNLKNVPFFPFTEEFEVYIQEFLYSTGDIYGDNERLFIFLLVKKDEESLNFSKNIELNRLYFSIKKGFMINVFDKEKNKYFSNFE